MTQYNPYKHRRRVRRVHPRPDRDGVLHYWCYSMTRPNDFTHSLWVDTTTHRCGCSCETFRFNHERKHPAITDRPNLCKHLRRARRDVLAKRELEPLYRIPLAQWFDAPQLTGAHGVEACRNALAEINDGHRVILDFKGAAYPTEEFLSATFRGLVQEKSISQLRNRIKITGLDEPESFRLKQVIRRARSEFKKVEVK